MANFIKPRFSLLPVFGDFEKEIDRVFGNSFELAPTEVSDWMPSVDVLEEANHYLVRVDIPGVDPKNIDIHIENNVLTIKGEREKESKEKKENFMRYERSKGMFYRRLSLPSKIDADKIKAKSKNGVLEIVIPKLEKMATKKVVVEEN